MTEDLESGGRRKKTSVTKYASSVFKESSVSAVSGIISTASTPRKIFRLIIFLVLTAAFIYQCVEFFTFVFEFPSVVDIEIKSPEEYMSPAFTICNNERIKRSKFCRKYPDRCEVPDADFCKKYPGYCGEGETQIPKEEYFFYNFEYEEIVEFGHDLEGLTSFDNISYLDPTIKNEALLRNRNYDPYDISICYSANAVVDDPEDPPYLRKHPMDFLHSSKFRYIFNPEENDKFDPDTKTGIFFAVHSPFEAVNPFQKGYFLEPGKEYKLTVWMQEEHRLTYPYKTNCMNYTKNWINKGKSGPRSQEMCRLKCIQDFLLKILNCAFAFIMYPIPKEKICSRNKSVEDANYTEQELSDFQECVLNCREECLKVKYFTEIRERYIARRDRYNRTIKHPSLIYVDVNIEDAEIMSFIYRPKYQSVEAFSYIGGFIGIWLGISLVQISEFFESAFLIGRYFWKKRICAKTNCVQ